jgi:iron complex outermembrane receptor protein
MNLLRLSSIPSLTLALAGVAALRAAAPGASSAAAAAHVHDPVALDQFVTSATPFPRNQVDLAQSTTVLSGRPLLLRQQATLGETLASETGIHASAFGPGASRPVIRGLDGERVLILENGTALLDASTVSPDHAVSVEPFLVDRIEAVRGPASLLYGSTAVGGVVNVISHRIETELHEEAVRGGAEARYDTATRGFARGGVLDLRLLGGKDHALVLHVDAFRRGGKEVRIPGYAESAAVRREEAEEARREGEPAPDFARYRLPNSALTSEGGAAGLSLVGRQGFAGFSHTRFNTEYGVPGHAHVHEGEEEGGVRIRLRQRRNDLQAEWRGAPNATVQGFRFRLGHADYGHDELEPDGEVGTRFTNRGHDARAELLHGGAPGWSGALGVQSTRSAFTAEGEEAFLPSSTTRGTALFAFQEVARGPLTWQFGARVEETRLAAERARARRDRELSGSAGVVWKWSEAWSLAASVSRTGRAPNVQERHADGPHAGTQSFEVGDPDLASEVSTGMEVSLRRRAGAVTGAVTLFANRFRGYIFERPTGEVAVEHDGEWELVDADDPEAKEHGGLPVYQFVQRDARFQGVEAEVLWHLHEARDSQFDLRFSADLVRAKADGQHLPRIPAARVGVGALWATERWSLGAEVQRTFRQERTAPGEPQSPGYGRLGAHVTRVLTTGRVRTEGFLRGSNLTDTEARPHPSFLKELAPLPGRSLTAGVRLTF